MRFRSVAPHLKFPTFRLDDRFADLQIDSAALHLAVWRPWRLCRL